ncbi:MAG: hypothetical protein ACTHQM_08540 [Thermoanaerobaculia bacterium]
MKALAVRTALLLIVAACASQPPLEAPVWNDIPSNITDALCARLRSDRFADSLVLVKITQPIVTTSALRALYPLTNQIANVVVSPTRAIPVRVSAECAWTQIDAAQRSRYDDSVVVELSAPLLNPAVKNSAGLFVRATTGGVSEWYWISLRPHENAWEMAQIAPISVH